MEPNVDDIRIARRQLVSLLEAGIPTDRIWPVVNRFHKRHSLLGLREVEKALGFSRIECLREDAKSARSGINYGKVLGDIAPRSALRRDIRRLAESIDARRSASTHLAKVG
jgi:pilus assembly protein CpaE